MEIKKTRKVTQETVIDHKCDVCGKLAGCADLPDTWHEFSHSHQGWGNDSQDSFEYFEVCSVDCFIKQLEDSIEEVGGYADDGAQVSGMSSTFANLLLERLKHGTP